MFNTVSSICLQKFEIWFYSRNVYRQLIKLLQNKCLKIITNFCTGLLSLLCRSQMISAIIRYTSKAAYNIHRIKYSIVIRVSECNKFALHLFIYLFFMFHRSRLGYNNLKDIEIVILLNTSNIKHLLIILSVQYVSGFRV